MENAKQASESTPFADETPEGLGVVADEMLGVAVFTFPNEGRPGWAAAWARHDRLHYGPTERAALAALQVWVADNVLRARRVVTPSSVTIARWQVMHRKAHPDPLDSGPAWFGELLKALGWQGGTIHQALDEVRRLKSADAGRVRQAVDRFFDGVLATALEWRVFRDQKPPVGVRVIVERARVRPPVPSRLDYPEVAVWNGDCDWVLRGGEARIRQLESDRWCHLPKRHGNDG